MVVQPALLRSISWLVSCVRTHVFVGPRHYCRNRNPTPIFSWNSTLSLPLSSLSGRGGLRYFFFYLPASPSSLPALLVSPLTTQLAETARHTRCLLSTTAPRAATTFTPPAGHQASKHGYGFAVRAPVLRPLHLLQHRARGKLLEKSDPNETAIIYGEDHDTAS